MNNFNVRSNNKKANGNKNVSLYSGVFTPLTNDGKNAFDTSLFCYLQLYASDGLEHEQPQRV